MKRRNFIGSGIYGGLFFCVGNMAYSDPSKRPNILLILADDLSWCDAGAYGNKDVHTPNIDKLAREGMRFDRAFTATAMCYPTRANLYTGIYPARNGAQGQSSAVGCKRSIVQHLRELGYRVGLEGKEHFRPSSTFPFDKPSNLDAYIRGGARPFCFIYASHHPHAGWPAVNRDYYDPARVAIPPYLCDTEETREALCRYYSEVTEFDDEVGVLLKMLDDNGVADKTMVIVTSEQGSGFPFCKWTCYDLGLRTQFIVRWPGVVQSDSSTEAMIEYVDVVPTLMEIAGGNPSAADTGLPGARDGGRGFDGISFLKVLTGADDEHKDRVYGIHTNNILNGGRYPIRSIRGPRYKYICNLEPGNTFTNNVTENARRFPFWATWVEAAGTDTRAEFLVNRYQHRPSEELYDTIEDPYELNNLAEERKHQSIKNNMRSELIDWMTWQRDTELENMR
jgi:N-sulfoglucosamine sulfohydrolase